MLLNDDNCKRFKYNQNRFDFIPLLYILIFSLPLQICQIRMRNVQYEDRPFLLRIVPHKVLKGVINNEHLPLRPAQLIPAYLDSTLPSWNLQSQMYSQPEKMHIRE